MRSVEQGNGIPPYLAPLDSKGQAASSEHGQLRAPVSREDARRLAAPPRSPSNPASITGSLLSILDETDEILVEDARAGVSPAEMVEQKLRFLLRSRGISSEMVGRTNTLLGRKQ
jgi:hypothetical protein